MHAKRDHGHGLSISKNHLTINQLLQELGSIEPGYIKDFFS